MDDLGVQYTDKKVEALEKKLEKAYKQASKEIGEKLKDFTEKSAAKESKYLQMVKDGTMTQDAFDKWKQGQVFYGDAWKSQQRNMAKVLADTNKTATAWINGEKADVFAFNGNYTAYDMEHGFGVNFGFDLYSEDSVKHLLKDNPKILPKSSLSISKDEKWNMRNIRSQITQGILQGESIPKIADRLANLIPERNRNQMVLHARTAMTSAQNAGRQERYKEAEALGIKFKKVWLATLDARTRETHQDADGQAVKPDEDFVVGGEKLAYPGDPSADAAETYNCRCTMVTELDDYPSSFDRRAYDTDDSGHRESYITKDTTYKEWLKGKQGGSGNTSDLDERIAKRFAEVKKEYSQNGTEYGARNYLPVTNPITGEIEEHSYWVNKEKDYEFPDGTYNGVYQKRDADVYMLENGTVFVQPSDLDRNLQGGDAEFFMERYFQLPEDFRDQIQKRIIIVDYRNPQDSSWAKKYKMKNFRSYATGGRDITFYASDTHDADYVVNSLAHEGGHYIDLYRLNAERTSESKEWAKAMRADEKISGLKGVSSYAQVHKHEDFAESLAEYVTNNDNLKTNFPNRYKILDEMVGGK